MTTNSESFKQSLQQSLWSFLYYLDESCKPNPKYMTDVVEQRVTHKRNQLFLLIQTSMLIFFLCNIITGNGPVLSNLQGCMASLIFYFVLYFSCRIHHEIFRVFYNLFALMCGAMLTQHDEKGIHGAWIAALSFPNFVYLVTGSIWHFILHAAAQAYLLNTYYQGQMLNSLMNLSSGESLKSITYHSNEVLVYSVGANIFLQHLLHNAYCHAVTSEKKERGT